MPCAHDDVDLRPTRRTTSGTKRIQRPGIVSFTELKHSLFLLFIQLRVAVGRLRNVCPCESRRDRDLSIAVGEMDSALLFCSHDAKRRPVVVAVAGAVAVVRMATRLSFPRVANASSPKFGVDSALRCETGSRSVFPPTARVTPPGVSLL